MPTVFSCWHDEFLIALLNLQSPRLSKPLFITNDSFGGVFLETFCKLAANPCLVIRRGTPVEDRIEQLVTGLATHRRVAIAADYGRPWYKARPTAAQIAGRLDGYVLAIRLEPRRKLRVPIGISGGIAYLPIPFSTYALWMDEPRRASEANLDEMLHGLSRHCYATQQAAEARAHLEAGPSA
ncbi:MAG TPA: hypothetical protein VJV78_47310 [Polyangiales bacterium]|nr:hypothetical protein [Polyangiales bacterium]